MLQSLLKTYVFIFCSIFKINKYHKNSDDKHILQTSNNHTRKASICQLVVVLFCVSQLWNQAEVKVRYKNVVEKAEP